MDLGPVSTNKLMDWTTGFDMTQQGLKQSMCSEKEAGKCCPAQRRQGQIVQVEAAVVLDFVC